MSEKAPCRWAERQIEAAARALCVLNQVNPDGLEPGNTPYGDENEVIDGETRSGEPAFYTWRLYVCDALAALDAAFPCHEPEPAKDTTQKGGRDVQCTPEA